MKKVFSTILITVLLTACATSASQADSATNAVSADPVAGSANPPSAGPEATSGVVTSDAAHTSDVDLTHLILGDHKISTSAQRGAVFTCRNNFNGGGAGGTGDWMNSDGTTWDLTKKVTVDGSVNWTSNFNISIQGDQRVFTTNDLPNHPTGIFPIFSTDDAYAVDRNPNSIQTQSLSFSLPVNPTMAAQPNCVGGEVGILLSGVVIFNAFDAEGRDAVAHEVQDNCGGHPQQSGLYHYHSLSTCIADTSTGHSALMGYAFDGFGIYGFYGEDGKELTSADLDECHGHTHTILWDGVPTVMYHYHATHEFPYVVSCYRGTSSVNGPIGGGQGGPPSGGPTP